MKGKGRGDRKRRRGLDWNRAWPHRSTCGRKWIVVVNFELQNGNEIPIDVIVYLEIEEEFSFHYL